MVATALEVLRIGSILTNGIPQKRKRPPDFLRPKSLESLLHCTQNYQPQEVKKQKSKPKRDLKSFPHKFF